MSERGYSAAAFGASANADDAGARAPAWLLDLEKAHDSLRRTARAFEAMSPPPIDLTEAAKTLASLTANVFDAMDERTDRLTAVRSAMGGIAAVDGIVRPAFDMDPAIGAVLTELHAAHAALGAAEKRLVALPPNVPEKAPDLIASRDTFRLHALDRPSIAPVIRVQKPDPIEVIEHPPTALPKPKTFEEMDLLFKEIERRSEETKKKLRAKREVPKPLPPPVSPPGFAKEIPPAITDNEFVAMRAREHFEEVTMIGSARAPLLGDPWRNALVLEKRMLCSIDAIASMGQRAIAAIEPLVLDSPAKDPSRAFGAGIILGCMAGRDALAAAERVAYNLRQNDPDSLWQFADALKIVPHDCVLLAMRTLLGDRDPAMRALAIDVLAFRGAATPEEIARAAIDAPVVMSKALVYAALTKSGALSDGIAQAIGSGDPAALKAAWIAMALSGHPHTSQMLTAALTSEEGETAALLLAISGDSRDADALLNVAIAKPARPFVTALGWAGAADHVVSLLNFLEHDDKVINLAAAYALERITGAGLWEEASVPAEEIDIPEPPDPDVGEPKPPKLARIVSDPRDLPAEPSPDTVTQPTTDVERWRAWWLEKGNLFKSGFRYRRGHAYTPLVSLQELDSGPCTPPERRNLGRELFIRTGQWVRLDPIELVVTQEEALKEWLPIAQRSSTKPGQWTRPYR
ncbi:MAG: hypothetical protein IPK82_13845 [Polyangiaceae bacterium]|nr:hypothetical protein [Polyangiaceae bacterium]